MLGQNYFFHNSILKYDTAIYYLFKDVHIHYTKADGTIVKDITLPVTKGQKRKEFDMIQRNDNIGRKVSHFEPRIDFILTNITRDPTRQVNVTHPVDYALDDDVYTSTKGIAHNFTYEVHIQTKNEHDLYQALEQILASFTPDYEVTLVLIPELNVTMDISIVLNDSQITIPYDIDEADDRVCEVTFDIELKGALFKPVTTSTTIREITVDLNDGADEMFYSEIEAESFTTLLITGDDLYAEDYYGNHDVENYNVTFDFDEWICGNGSMVFDGDSYLAVDDNNNWDFMHTNFTIDFWAKRDAINTHAWLFGQASSAGLNINVSSYIDATNDLYFYYSTDTGTETMPANISIDDTDWHHYAFVRINDVIYIYVDGVLGNTQAETGIFYDRPNEFRIGAFGEHPLQEFVGHMDQFRIMKGTALWTDEFSLTDSGLFYTAGTLWVDTSGIVTGNLLVTGDENPLEDYNGDHVLNTVGHVASTTDEFVCGTGSMIFDGDDYITIPDSNDFYFDGDFTIDMWVKRTQLTEREYLFSHASEVFTILNVSSFIESNGDIYFYGKTDTETLLRSGDGILDTNWHHIAFVVSGSTLLIFLDGYKTLEYDFTGNFVNVDQLFVIGGITTSQRFSGYMDHFRLTNGTALWANNFGLNDTSLFYEPGTLQAFSDGSITGNLFITGENDPFIDYNGLHTLVNDGVIQSTESICGNASMLFDENSRITISDSDDFFIEGDYTVDCWIKGNNTNRNYIFSHLNDAGSILNIAGWSENGSIVCYARTSTETIYRTGGTNVSDNNWHHIAYVISGQTVLIFVDGINVVDYTFTGSFVNIDTNFTIGALNNAVTTNLFDGYIDQFRITKGTALWTTDFALNDRKLFYPVGTIIPEITGDLLITADDDVIENTGTGSYTLTEVGTTTTDSTDYNCGNGSMHFAAEGDGITIPEDTLFEFAGDFTIDYWLKREAVSGNQEFMFGYSATPENGGDWSAFIALNGTGTIHVQWKTASSSVNTSSDHNYPIDDTDWYHLAFVRNNDILDVYLDGINVMTTDLIGASNSVPGAVWGIGKGGAFNLRSFQGNFDQFRINGTEALWTDEFDVTSDIEMHYELGTLT